MRRYVIYIIILLALCPISLLADVVSNVRAQQEGNHIVLLYDLNRNIKVSDVRICIDNKERSIPSKFLSGDVNKTVTAGKDKRIEYDLLSDYTDGLRADNVSFVISAGLHEYVDLGLSVKWATCNVGATKPEEYGDYFAWGETNPKTTYDWATYKWCNGSHYTFTKYNTSRIYGAVDNKTTFDLEDDAAVVNWGGSWRMPTDAEMAELFNNCTWTWTTQNGVNGYKVTGPNGKSIFLPAAGYRNASSLNNAGSNGFYWSSSLLTDSPYRAWEVYCASRNRILGYENRCLGQSVRPVCP